MKKFLYFGSLFFYDLVNSLKPILKKVVNCKLFLPENNKKTFSSFCDPKNYIGDLYLKIHSLGVFIFMYRDNNIFNRLLGCY